MNVSQGPIDIKDPRIRVTFADVAMRIARDGPMYGVIILVGVLALRGTTSALESILGAAFALQARSHPPPENDKMARGINIVGIGLGTMIGMHTLSGCIT